MKVFYILLIPLIIIILIAIGMFANTLYFAEEEMKLIYLTLFVLGGSVTVYSIYNAFS